MKFFQQIYFIFWIDFFLFMVDIFSVMPLGSAWKSPWPLKMTAKFAIQIHVLTFWNLHSAAIWNRPRAEIPLSSRSARINFVHAAENNKLLKNCSPLSERSPLFAFRIVNQRVAKSAFPASEKLFLHTRAVILSSFEVERAQGW
jgi:hypothetical protein